MWWTVVLSFLGKIKWYVWALGVLTLSNLFTYAEWQHTSHALKQERTVHAQDIANFKATQVAANMIANAQRQSLLTESKANAAKADADYSTLLTRYHASLVRYGTHQGHASQPDNHQLPATQGGNGPGTSADVPSTITISGNDAQICAVNTARLQSVHDWAISLPRQP